jgi:hypothetical protein
MKHPGFLSHAAAAMIVTILIGLIYVSVQQSHRSAANDPQLQIARDITERLKNNRSIDHLMTGDTIDISKSGAVFTVLYTPGGEPLRSNGLLDGNLPRVPKGVLDYSRRHEEDVLSWQPRRGVRMALVVESVQAGGIGFVAVGRSLQETEKRVSNLNLMLLLGWLACLAVILIHFVIVNFQNRKKQV